LQAEIERLVDEQFDGQFDEQFIEAAVFTEDEGILEARDQKDVVHFEGHQVFEAFKALFGVHYALGDAVDDHGDILVQLRNSSGVRYAVVKVSTTGETEDTEQHSGNQRPTDFPCVPLWPLW
jgi:hypothetical protein